MMTFDGWVVSKLLQLRVPSSGIKISRGSDHHSDRNENDVTEQWRVRDLSFVASFQVCAEHP